MAKLTLAICALALVHFASTAKASSSDQPVISQHPLNSTVIRNDPVTLECRASGLPQPLIEWYKDGQLVRTAPDDPESHRILLPDGSLFFLRAMQNKKEQDAGVYWCIASNSEGVARSKNATLDIAYMRDEFRNAPKDMDAVMGENAVLECSPPKGHPKPVVKWKKDGDNLDLTSAKRIKIDPSGNLVIFNVQKRDQGRYQCTAENTASVRTSKPMRLKVHDPPFFVHKPESKSAVAGDDVMIECQASGDPHPDIVWTKEEGDIDISKAKIVHGKGLRIENVHPSDEGTYMCTAKNIVGKVTAKAVLLVLEKPVISVQPPTSVQARAGERVQLDCIVTGDPKPVSFWSKEGATDGEVLFPGELLASGVRVTSDGSLILESPKVEDSGHYTCSVANQVGSAIARSHLLVYDPNDFKYGPGSPQLTEHNEIYHSIEELDMNEARLATTSEGVRIKSAIPTSPTSIKINWEFYAAHKYLQGYHIWYKKSEESEANYVSIPVLHSEATSFVFNRLEEHTEYDIFVQPFYKNVLGRPAPIKNVVTHQDEPSEAPVIENAVLVNSSNLFVSWTRLSLEHTNGPLTSYRIVVKPENGSSFNYTVSTSVSQANLRVNDLKEDLKYSVVIAAENKVGTGPFSAPVQIEAILSTQGNNKVFGEDKNSVTWIIAVVSAVTGVLLIISAVFICKQRAKKPGYLANRSCTDFGHCQLPPGQAKPIIKRTASTDAVQPNQTNLWIDKGFGEYEKELSDSSERKLLNCQSTTSSHSNSDTEYAYVDRHNLSSFTNSSSGARSNRNGQNGAESPEPYATTDIINKNTQDVYNQNTHYAAPLLPVYLANHQKSEIRSCDDLCNAQNVYYQGTNRNTSSKSSSKRSKGSATPSANFNRKVMDMPPRNLLDMIPPPPNHPPPPPGGGGSHYSHMSQESVISPKYLFQHPAVYQQHAADTRPSYQLPPGNRHRIRPTNQGHYEEPTQCFREELYGVPPSFHHQRQSSLKTSDEQHQRNFKLSPGIDLDDEIESFNHVVTQFASSSARSSSGHGSARASTRTSSGSHKSSYCGDENKNDSDCGGASQ